MAFFGLTFMGSQAPFRDKRLTLPKYEVPVGTTPPKLELFYPKLPPIGPLGHESTEHHRSYEKYQETIKQRQLKKCRILGDNVRKNKKTDRFPSVAEEYEESKSQRTSSCSLEHQFYNPNQEYRVPLTCGQDIGWWLPMNPPVKPEDALPWIRVPRHPLLRSPITKLVDDMAVADPLFSLF